MAAHAPASRLAASADADAPAVVDEIIGRTFGIASVDDHLEYQSIPQWDSLGHVTLMVELESALGVTIDDSLMMTLRSVRAIRDFASDPRAASAHVKPSPTAATDTGVAIHRGLEGVHVDHSAITRIDGEDGVLEYRGYSIHDLVERSTFEQTTWLLLHGELPDSATLNAFQRDLATRRSLPPVVTDMLGRLTAAHPVDALMTGVCLLGALESRGADESHETALEAGLSVIAQIPTIIATHHALRSGRTPLPPDPRLDHTQDFVRMLLGTPDAATARFFERDLILHADHGSNASAFAARVTMSCQTGMHAAITAAIAAFGGAVHGGAAERVTQLIDTVGCPQNAEEHVRACHRANRPVMGFGHRVYRTEDPRVRHYRAAAQELAAQGGQPQGLQVVEAVAAAMEPYARHGVGANVDLYAGLVYRMLGLRDDLAVPLFIAGRVAGWVAQTLEQKANNVLVRPLLHYVGEVGRQLPGRPQTA